MDKPKKKKFIELAQVKTFMDGQTQAVTAEYRELVKELEIEGFLSMPHGEKIAGENLFAIRVINAGNVRVFYVYGMEDMIYGLHGYVKKTGKIPESEMKQAERIRKLLRAKGLMK